jgi:hypothetical protein
MIKRTLQNRIQEAAAHYPVVTLTGPRQSGKTTLVRETFPHHAYVSLETPDDREFALEDSRGFLNQFPDGVVFDEIQRAPDLFSYLQGMVDEDNQPGRYILTGSQNFLLAQQVSQSLAGRTAVLHLLPFSQAELESRSPRVPAELTDPFPKYAPTDKTLVQTLFTGFYPRIHDMGLPPQDWLRNYYQTYIERDVRTIVNIGDLETFSRFVRLCAGRSGQLLNLSSLGADCGISHTTARKWLSVLESSFIVYLLRPFHNNLSKRLVKSPKLYFLDTGLLCYLLRIREPEQLVSHAARGALFETFVVAELLKNYLHRGLEADIFFWRDTAGHEIDVVIEAPQGPIPVEVKSGETIASDFFKGLHFWRTLPDQQNAPAVLVYGGDKSLVRNNVHVYSWHLWL